MEVSGNSATEHGESTAYIISFFAQREHASTRAKNVILNVIYLKEYSVLRGTYVPGRLTIWFNFPRIMFLNVNRFL
jgi:hypothetical protein